MTSITCPKCRQGADDGALDAGECPACGFPLDGPLVIAGGAPPRSSVRYIVGAGAVAVATAGYAGYAYFGKGDPAQVRYVDATPADVPAAVVRHLAPAPHAAKPRDPWPDADPPEPPPVPAVVTPPKKDGPRPVGVVMRVDPKIVPERHFDQPDDEARLTDLNSGDKVVLTGRLRALRIGSVSGKASVDASGLVAEEIVITGDLNGEAVVQLHAPGGKVTVGGTVGGVSKLSVAAPDGEVTVGAGGRLTGSAVTTVTAKRLDVAGKLLGAARLNVTFTTGGSLRLTFADEGAVVTYRRSAAADPPLVVEKGTVRGGAKVITE